MTAKFLTTVATAGAIALGSFTFSFAGGHLPYEKRQQAMKAVGGGTKTIGDMLKGATDFDAAKANAALASMNDAAKLFGEHFPEGSDDPKSEAGPKIWSDRAGFDAAVAKFQGDLAAAVAAAPSDKAGVQAAFGQVASNCKSCHENYRVKKN